MVGRGGPRACSHPRYEGARQPSMRRLPLVRWMVQQPEASSSGFRHMVVHSDSTSAIARVRHTGAGPGQRVAVRIFNMLPQLYLDRRSVELKGHTRVLGNARADHLPGKAVEQRA
jgi:hypothetical protein